MTGKSSSHKHLLDEVRRVWFTGEDGLTVDFQGSPFYISREEIVQFGGPRLQTHCRTCAIADWISRLTGCNQFVSHKCSDPARRGGIELACSRVAYNDWIAVLKDYNFTTSVDVGLPGVRGLVLSNDPTLVLFPGANRGMITLRQRLSPFQIDIKLTAPSDLSGYDFVLHNCGYRPRPKIDGQKRPKTFVYCHDHHGSGLDTLSYYQDNLNEAPDAIFTPYPHIWKHYYQVSPSTEVVFMPHQSPTFFARPVASEKKTENLLVIGVASQWAYPERVELAATVGEEIRSNRPAGWYIHGGGEHDVDASSGYSRPNGGLLLSAWDSFLAQFKIVVFGQDRWGYLVTKYSEVLASGALMICPEIPDLALLGLKPNVHYVPLERPVGTQFVKQAKHILKHFDSTYATIATAGHQWYMTRMDQLLFNKFQTDVNRLVGV